jgi:hypothetical protein
LPDNKRESQTTEITQPISGQPLRMTAFIVAA